MTVAELMQSLQENLDAGVITEESEVRLATQPHWPLEYSVSGVVARHPKQEEIEEIRELMLTTPREEWPSDASEQLDALRAESPVLWLLEGTQLGYASRSLWDE